MKKITLICATIITVALVLCFAMSSSASTPDNFRASSDAADISETTHEHAWFLLGSGDTGFTVACACGSQYSTPFTPCEHELTIAIEEFSPEFHTYECEHCVYYARMAHEFKYCSDEDAHYKACVDCGYVVEEAPHTFENIGFDPYSHTEKCAECGYVHTNEHQLIAEIEGDFTLIHCDSCDYISEKRCNHDNAYMVGELYHMAWCYRCDEVVEEQHTYFDGACECGHESVENTQYGIVTDFYRHYDEEGNRIYCLEMLIDHKHFEFDLSSKMNYRHEIEIGSFVEVTLFGNEVVEMIVHVDYNVVDDAENFGDYVSSEIMDTYSVMDYVSFDDIIIGDIIRDDELTLEFDRISATYDVDYIVYNLCESEMGRLRKGDAILQLQVEDVIYFIIIW